MGDIVFEANDGVYEGHEVGAEGGSVGVGGVGFLVEMGSGGGG